MAPTWVKIATCLLLGLGATSSVSAQAPGTAPTPPANPKMEPARAPGITPPATPGSAEVTIAQLPVVMVPTEPAVPGAGAEVPPETLKDRLNTLATELPPARRLGRGPIEDRSISLMQVLGLDCHGCREAEVPFAQPYESAVGFIDTALVGTRVRLRLDLGYQNFRPDSSEFYLAKNQAAGNGRGLLFPERRVDLQEMSAYFETALSARLGLFAEIPVRATNPEVNTSEIGFGDVSAGFKLTYFAQPDLIQTFQLRVVTPTGESYTGLGTGHTAIEPGLLVYQRWTQRLLVEAEVRDWIPISGTDFAGNVLRYGVGLSYDMLEPSDRLWVRPVGELVGWTQLRGRQFTVFDTPGVIPAQRTAIEESRDTVINLNFGVRVGRPVGDFYVGYGRAVTGTAWFENNFRFELRLFF